MRVEFSKAALEVAIAIPQLAARTQLTLSETPRWCAAFQIYRHGEVNLVWKDYIVNLDEYMSRNAIASIEEAATEIELRENRIAIVSSFERPRVASVEEAIERVLDSFPIILERLRKVAPEDAWVLWANIQFHVGDFDEEPIDHLNVRAVDLTESNGEWWFMADVYFAKQREKSEQMLKHRISGAWGETHAPLQILCYSN